MGNHIERLYADLVARAAQYGISVGQAELDNEVPGEFDGVSITLNNDYDPAERVFYLAHSIGSIAEWSIQRDRSSRVFRELREAKRTKDVDKACFERALSEYLSFETRTWEFAVWLFHETGHTELLAAFVNFGRADMEAMRIYHATGRAPVWREFFTAWNEEVRRGVRRVEPLTVRPIPPFQAAAIPKQEIVQEDDGES
jgi:hypothetical protein